MFIHLFIQYLSSGGNVEGWCDMLQKCQPKKFGNPGDCCSRWSATNLTPKMCQISKHFTPKMLKIGKICLKNVFYVPSFCISVGDLVTHEGDREIRTLLDN